MKYVILVSLGLCTAAGCRQAERPALAEDVIVTASDTLIDEASLRLGKPSELVIGGNGDLYVTDVAHSDIKVLDSGGGEQRIIGRSGAGPGEFARPRSVTPIGDSLWVADTENGRFQVLTVEGVYARGFSSPPRAEMGAIAFAGDGSAFVAMNGANGSLAQRVSPTGIPGATLGRPLVQGPAIWNFTALKAEIASGRVPGLFRNLTLPVPAADGGVWLMLQGEGEIQRFDARDSLRWRRTLTEPELVGIRDEFFRRNRADSNPSSLFTLSYLVMGLAVGDDLWVLLRQPADAPMVVLILDRDGMIRSRLRFPTIHGASALAVDCPRKHVYVLSYEDATLLRAAVPGAVCE